jgi:flagellar hook-associated protein 3 FlgL
MSSSIGSIGTGYGFLATLTTEANSVHQQLDTLTEQASSGLVAQTYAGLSSSGAAVSLSLNPQLTALQTYQTNISQATATMQVTQSAMTQLQQIASTFAADMPNLTSTNTQEINLIAQQAQAALTQVAGLLDTQDGSVYVFGGQDTSNPPVPQPDSILTSGFYTQINAAVSNLATAGATATIASTRATAMSNATGTSPFSAYMSQPAAGIGQQVVQTGDGTTVNIGLLASANSNVTSTSASTTGSYMRDLMRALATIGSMSSSQASASGFVALVQDTTSTLNGVVSDMAGDVGALGNTQSNLTATATHLTDTSTALTGQVSAVQDADMATTLSNLSAIQTQLQASYRMIAIEGTLSLANYLPVA